MTKAILLCGGRGVRLLPMTRSGNKHLIRIFNQPIIESPITSIQTTGIKDVLVITGVEHAGSIVSYLGNGSSYGLNFSYRYQENAGGIAEALALAESFVGNDNCFVILGDNVFDYNFKPAIDTFKSGAKVFLKRVKDPTRFGVAELGVGKIKSIEEKPSEPKSNLAVTGAYIFDSTLFDKIRKCSYSARGELEITDVNNLYIEEDKMTYEPIDGFWSDAGTIESIHICEQYYFNKSIKNKKLLTQ